MWYLQWQNLFVGSRFLGLPFCASFRHLYVNALCYHKTSPPILSLNSELSMYSNPVLVLVKPKSAFTSVLNRRHRQRLPSALWTEAVCLSVTLIFGPLKGPLWPNFTFSVIMILASVGKHNGKIISWNIVFTSPVHYSLDKYSIIGIIS